MHGRLPRAARRSAPASRGCCASASATSTSSTTTRCSATACSTSRRSGLPLVTTLHHPITFDRRIDLAAATTLAQEAHAAPLVRLPADAGQGRPPGAAGSSPRRSPRGATSSRDFGVDPARMQVILLGVDDGFVPPDRAPGARPDPGDGQRRRPDEGHRHAARGVRQAAHRARPRAAAGHQAGSRAAAPSSSSTQLAIGDAVRFVHGVSDAELVELMGSAEVACVPSLYEGFSLPTAELMALRDPAGRLPGRRDPRGRRARRPVRRPGHARATSASSSTRSGRAARRPRAPGPRWARAGRRRVEELFSWRAVAAATAAAYEDAIARLPPRSRQPC